MENEEIGRVVGEAIKEALSPMVESIGQLMTPPKQEEKKSEPSKSVQDWLHDKETNPHGGKDLFGVTPHNSNPKPRTDEKTV